MKLTDIIAAIPQKPYYLDGDKDDPNGVIYCADCLDILPHIPAKSIDLVLTDPPYGVEFTEWDKDGVDLGWYYECQKITDLILITTGIKNMWDYPRPNWIVSWSYPKGEKRSMGGGINCWEPVLIYGKNPFPLDHKHFKPLHTPVFGHPCPKPLYPWNWLVEKSSEINSSVLDPFLGSGTTAVACKQLSRKFIGIEISEKYCEIARQRLQGTPESLFKDVK